MLVQPKVRKVINFVLPYILSTMAGSFIFLLHGLIVFGLQALSNDFLEILGLSFLILIPILGLIYTPTMLLIKNKNMQYVASVVLSFLISTFWLMKFKKFALDIDILVRGWNWYLYFLCVGIVFTYLKRLNILKTTV